MSNFWKIHKTNFFTPTLLLFGFFLSFYLFSIPLRDVTNLFQTMYISIILIFSFTVFTFNYYFIQSAFEAKKHLHVIMNFFFISVLAFLLYQAAFSLSRQYYPSLFLSNFLGANVALLLQIGVNQKLQYLKQNLILFYINAIFALVYVIEPDILTGLTDQSIRLFQSTAFIIICAELYRAVQTSKVINLLSESKDQAE